jgi:spermidine/putrescine transport system ATP-binding protein
VLAPPASGAKAGDQGALALRPEQARISAHAQAAELKNHFHGTVRGFLYLGDVTVYTVELDNGVSMDALLANSAPGRAKFFDIGDDVSIAWRHDAGLFLHE